MKLYIINKNNQKVYLNLVVSTESFNIKGNHKL